MNDERRSENSENGGAWEQPLRAEFFEKPHPLHMPFEFIQIPANGQGAVMSLRGLDRPSSCLAGEIPANEPTAGAPGAGCAADAALKALSASISLGSDPVHKPPIHHRD